MKKVKVDLTEKQAVQKLQFLNQWIILEDKGVRKLNKTYRLPFTDSIRFVEEISFICTKFHHHPRLEISRDHLSITWFSTMANGLTDLDFASAEACDVLFETALFNHKTTIFSG